MSVYQVTLRKLDSPNVSKIVEVDAATREQAANNATQAGFRVALVKQVGSEARDKKSDKQLSKKELIKLFRGLASLHKANISTSDALLYYAQGLPEPNLRACLVNIRNTLETGVPVNVAFAKEQKFDSMIITIIEAGSNAGQLAQAFSSLARRIKIEVMFSSKLRSAIMVPSIVILFQIGLFIYSQVYVVAQVEDTLASVHMEPDPLSKGIFAFSHFVQAVWPIFVAALVTLIVSLFRSAAFRGKLLKFGMAHWNILSKLVKGLRQSAYIGTLQMLYANGVDLGKASTLASRVVQGTPMYEGFIKAAQVFETTGVPFADALKRHADLDPQITHMIGIGEKSASLAQQLELLRDIYEEDTEAVMADFTQIINFITLAIAVVIIGFVFAGAMLPIFLMGPRMMQSGNM